MWTSDRPFSCVDEPCAYIEIWFGTFELLICCLCSGAGLWCSLWVGRFSHWRWEDVWTSQSDSGQHWPASFNVTWTLLPTGLCHHSLTLCHYFLCDLWDSSIFCLQNMLSDYIKSRDGPKFGERRSSAEHFGRMLGSVRLRNMWLFGRSSAELRQKFGVTCGFAFAVFCHFFAVPPSLTWTHYLY